MVKKFQNLILLTFLFFPANFQNKPVLQGNTDQTKKHKVILIELGSDRCAPCLQMQPVLESIKKRFMDQVKLQLYDAYTKEGTEIAKKYKIEAIPTQVFLDSSGVEYYRHRGYFPEEEMINILNLKGVY